MSCIRQLFAACPAWSEIAAGDERSKAAITTASRRLAEHEVADLRVAFEREIYDAEHSEGGLSTEDMSKLYVVIRFIFAVPGHDDLDAPLFWNVWPPREVASACWPVALDVKGHPELVHDFTNWMGEPYRALDEFDDFHARYGRRPAMGTPVR